MFYETSYDYVLKKLSHDDSLLINAKCINWETLRESNGLAQIE